MGMPSVATSAEAERLLRIATSASVATAALLIVAELAAWLTTGSVSVLASLVDSVMDAGASLVNLLAVRWSLQPADADHRFGHGKAQPLAALGQAAFIADSAVFLGLQAVDRLLRPQPITNAKIGLDVGDHVFGPELPRHGAHDAETHRVLQSQGAAESQHHLSLLNRLDRAQRQKGQPCLGYPEKGDVRLGVGTHDLRHQVPVDPRARASRIRYRYTGRQGHLRVIGPAQDMSAGHDVAVGIDDDAGAGALSAADSPLVGALVLGVEVAHGNHLDYAGMNTPG
jgi:hypothetical protein